MNLTFPQNKKKDGKSKQQQIFAVQMKCKDTGSLNETERQFLA